MDSLYKWLAKVLANGLKKVVGKVNSEAQMLRVDKFWMLLLLLMRSSTPF